MSNSLFRRSIVVVDERPWDYRALADFVAEPEVDVTFVTSARTALRLPHRNDACVWFINTRLGDADGFDVFEMLTQLESSSRIFLIADAYSPEDELRALRLGACAYLCKPVRERWLSSCRPLQNTSQSIVSSRFDHNSLSGESPS